MRPYRLIDEAADEDDEYPSVVPIGGAGRSRSRGLGGARREPWTPRDTDLPATTRRAQAPPGPSQRGLTTTQRWMIAGFVVICAGMILGMLLVRLWDDASRAVAALPPE